MESSGGAATTYSDFMVTVRESHEMESYFCSPQWTLDGEINNRPIYSADGGSKWMAVKTVSSNFIPSWIVSLTQFGQPGSSSGLMFGNPFTPQH